MPFNSIESEGHHDERVLVPGTWTLDTLYVHLSRVIADLARLGDEHIKHVGLTSSTGFSEAELRNEQRFQAQEKAVTAAILAADRAVAKAESASEKRFDSVNEFRASMNDQANKFIPRTEAEQRMLSNSEKIDALGNRLERIEGRGQGLNAGWVILTGAVGLVGVLTAIFMAASRH
jgi:hypothetical protein